MESLVDKSLFNGLQNKAWLFTGAESPPLKAGLEAVSQYLHNRELGAKGRERNQEIEFQCKQQLAAMLKGKASDIALLSNSSEIISMIAQSLVFKEGDNVVINTLEFPSGVLPWLLLKEKGLEVRVVEHADWQISEQAILDKVDSRTKLVVTSQVSYLSGARLDSKKLYGQLKNTGTLLLLDVTQSLGVVPVDMNDADFTVCSSYKWLLSVHGVGILGINPQRMDVIKPSLIGWRSVKGFKGISQSPSFEWMEDARRFEWGYPNYAAIYALNQSAAFLNTIGIDSIERHVLDLGQYCLQRMEALAFERMTPIDPAKRAGNICFSSDQGEEIAEALYKRNVYVMGGDGRFRLSIHLFNDKNDVDRAVEALAEITAAG